MNEISVKRVVAWTVGSIAALFLAIALVFALSFVGKSYSRYQKRADANNRVQVTHINIRNAQQQAQVVRANNARVQAQAEQRVIEAEGIRKAQDLISATLTALYVQHEAIKAQASGSQAGDRIYIPVGPSGVPLVADVSETKREKVR